MNYWVTFALLLAALGTSELSRRRITDALAEPLETVQPSIAGWTQTGSKHLPPGTLRALLPTSYIARTYGRQDRALDFLVVFYAQQRAGESMHSPKACLPASGWEIWKRDSATISVGATTAKINKYFIQNSGQRMLVFYWYQSKRRVIADEYLGKLLLIRDTLLDGHTAGSLVRIIVPDQPGMSEQALAFAAEVLPQVQRCFGGERGRNLPQSVAGFTSRAGLHETAMRLLP